MSRRQRDDMVILAHIREQHRLSLQSYGRPRKTEELQELGLQVGHRRVGRLMRGNGIKIIRTHKYKMGRVKNLIWGIKFIHARPTAIMRSTSRPTCRIRTSLIPPMVYKQTIAGQWMAQTKMDLSRICSAPLTWYFATKERHHGIEPYPGIPR
nr:IS3 family transposase [Oceaniglobus ichthyenteri]